MEAGTLAVSGEAGASGDARSGTHWAAAAAMTGCGPTAASYPPQGEERYTDDWSLHHLGVLVGAGGIIEPPVLRPVSQILRRVLLY